MKFKTFLWIGGLFIAMLSTQLQATLTLTLIPVGGGSIESGDQVTLEVFVTTDVSQTIRSGQIDLPCTVTGGAGSVGTLSSIGLTTDPDGDGLPGPGSTGTSFLIPNGLGPVSTSACLTVATIAPGQSPITLTPGSQKYLGTIIFDAPCGCAGDFTILFEGTTIPPVVSNTTRFRDGGSGGGSLIAVNPVGVTLSVGGTAGTCCNGMSCLSDTISRCACNQLDPTAQFFAARTCGDSVPCGCVTDGECNDGFACSGVEACDQGTHQCYVAQSGMSCNDGQACTLDACDGFHAYADADGCASVPAGKLYWTDTGTDRIRRSAVDGSGAENVVLGLSDPQGIAVDGDGGKVYWTDSETLRIQRSNLDGTELEDVITTGLADPQGIAVDSAAGKIYWADLELFRVKRADLDGSNVETVVFPAASSAWGIALDVASGKMYWPNAFDYAVRRSNLDGSGVEDLVALSPYYPTGMALDLATGKMYFGGYPGRVYRADLDGSSLELLVDLGIGDLRAIAVDPGAGHMYWTSSYYDQGVGAFNGRVWRADLDGSNQQVVISTAVHGVDFLGALALDLSSGKMYFSDAGLGGNGPYIRRANLDGSNLEIVLNAGTPGISLDLAAGKMYWSNYTGSAGELRRANLNGSNVEVLYSAPELYFQPFGLAHDAGSAKLYLTDLGSHLISRINVDGSNLENIVPAFGYDARSVALDPANGKLYWSQGDSGEETGHHSIGMIGRANLDGSVGEWLVTDLVEPRGVAVDAAGDRLYWTDAVAHKVQSSHLDGSDVATITTTGLGKPIGIAFEATEGKVYFATQGTQPAGMKIQRVNADGTGVTNVVTSGLSSPVGLAVVMECCTLYGDVVSPSGTGPSLVDVDDILYVVAGFMYSQGYPGADLYPCGGNGLVDVDDILAEMESFVGNFACLDRCAP